MTEESNNIKERVLIVDDHPIFRFGLAGLITEQSQLEVSGHADSAPAALADGTAFAIICGTAAGSIISLMSRIA